MRTKEQLKQVAIDYFEGKIFSDRQINESDMNLLPNIFFPLFGVKEDSFKDKEQPVMIFEYLYKAGEMGINGYPHFLSCQFLIKDELDIVSEYYKVLEKQRTEFNED